jgi:pimeloyl-ACP methyl ester carboxylesterase
VRTIESDMVSDQEECSMSDKTQRVRSAARARASTLVALAAIVAGIAGGLSADAATAHATAGPAATQAQWILSKLNDGGVTVADVEERFSPAYLKLVTPAPEIVRALEDSRLERGPFRFLRWARPPTATEAIAIVSTRQESAAIRVRVAGARVNALEVTAPPPDVARGGRFTGRHDIGGRKLMIRCVGSGTPTVVFEAPLIEDWYLFQERLARVTRVCAYDRANARWGQSDPAATPRSGNALMADLRALLRAAHVPAPYVLVGHSNSGLFAQIFASRYPKLTAGLVLVDAVSATYFERDLALQKKHRPRDQYLQIRADRLRVPPAVVDLERLDIARSQQELKSLLARRPLRKMPLVVLSHGKAPPPQTDPRGQKLASATEALWRRLQTELAQLVPGARHVIARHSDHDIPNQQPELVIEAVRAVVKAVRDPSSW